MDLAAAITAVCLVVLLICTLATVTNGPVYPALFRDIFDDEVSSDGNCFCFDHIVDCSSRSKIIIFPDDICDDNPMVIDISWNALSSAGIVCRGSENGTSVYCGMPTHFVEDVEVFLVRGNQLNIFAVHGDVYKNLRILNLSLNRISEAQFHFLHQLEVLDFSHNHLTSVPWRDIRISMPNVKELDLSHNLLSLNRSDEFRYAYKLQSLNLSDNNISVFYGHEDLLQLESLDLSENPLNFISYEFSSLKNLEYLNLSYTNISGFLIETFYCLDFLQILDLSHNNLTHLPNEAFRYAINLQLLDLSHNKLNEIELKNVSDELSSYLRCYGNNSSPPLINPLRMLKSLDLSNNEIEGIKSDTFSALHGLRTLNLSRNAMSYFAADALSVLEELEVLDLSGNQLTSLPPGAFVLSKNLIHLNVSNNLLQSLGDGGTFVGLSALLELDASWNFVSELAEGVLDPLERLQRLDLSWNVLRRMRGVTFDNLKALRWLNISNNQLQTVPEELLRDCRIVVSLERNELAHEPVTCSARDARLWYYALLERAMYWPTAYLPPLPWALLLAAAIVYAAALNKSISMPPIHPVRITVETI